MNKTTKVSVLALGITFAAASAGVLGAATVPPGSEASAPTESTAPASPESTGAVATETTAGGVPVALDAAFGTGGVLSANVNVSGHDRFISVVEGADGAVYASGYVDVGEGDRAFAVTKFAADGTVDSTYGEAGTAVVNVVVGGGGVEVARGLVVADDGTVTISGPAEHDPAAAEPANEDADVFVVRLDAAGALDATFGEAGIARLDLGAGKAVDAETYLADNSWSLAARDGGYVVFSSSPNQDPARTDSDFVLAGLTDAGAVDETFGDAGFVIADIDAADDNARHIKIDAEGRILAAGYRRDGDGIVSPVLIRVLPDGTLDETFGDGGIANHQVLDAVAEAYSVDFQGDNYVLTGYGRGTDSETVDQIVFRFTADGALDGTFGDGGVTRVDLAGQDDRGRNVAVLPSGEILVVGSGKLDETNLDGLVTLFDADGQPLAMGGDTHGPLALLDLGGPNDAFFGVTVTADGSAVYVAGFKGATEDTDEQDDSVLVRFILGG